MLIKIYLIIKNSFEQHLTEGNLQIIDFYYLPLKNKSKVKFQISLSMAMVITSNNLTHIKPLLLNFTMIVKKIKI